MKKYFLTSCLSLALLACTTSQQNFTYQNPISEGIDSNGLRDCQVLKDGDSYYLTGTAFPHWDGQEQNGNLNEGIPLYKSKDLLTWEFVDYIVKRPEADKWYHRRFWAPEIQKINGKYYALLNCRNAKQGYDWQHIGYAVADHIEGPYKVVHDKKPLARGNDMTLFQDDDGKTYAFWHNVNDDGSFWMGSSEIDLESGTFIGASQSAITSGPVAYELDEYKKPVLIYQHGRHEKKISQYKAWDSAGIEGAYVIKRDGTYYLFYSSWTRGYEIGYATADNIRGPWTKAANNPIYGACNLDLAKKRGFEVAIDPENPFYAVGHNQVFEGPDGSLWLSCHGQSKQHKAPYLVIDKLHFNADGSIQKMKPTYTTQNISY